MTPPKITQFKHSDPALWPLVGPLVTSREVVKALAGPVYSSDAATWWVAVVRGKAVGFALLTETDKEYWEAGSYVLPDHRHKGVHLSLCAARTRHVATLPPKPVRVCCRKARGHHYTARGFAVASERGDWVYGVKAPAETEGVK